MKRLVILLIICINGMAGYTHQKKTRLTGTFKYHNKKLPTNIMLWTVASGIPWDNTVDYTLDVDTNDNKFNFEFPELTKPMIYSLKFLEIINGKKKVIDMGTFYVEPSDQVHVDVYDQQIKSGSGYGKDSLVFSGPGSAKYRLIETLNKDLFNYMNTKSIHPKKVDSESSVKKFLSLSEDAYNNYSKRKLDLINNAKGVSPEMRKIINYQYLPYYIWHASKVVIFYGMNKDNAEFKRKIKEYYRSFFEIIEQPDESVLNSISYFQLANSLLKYNAQMSSEDDKLDLKTHYNNLKKTYSGKIRERMLMHLFSGAYGMANLSKLETMDSLLMDASKYLTSVKGKEVIANKLTFKRGTPLFNADFIDLNNKLFNTNSLKGRVFLLDMWGLGCSVCAGFHQVFEKEIWPLLKDNKDFVMLSVFDGKTKQNWEKGIASKFYTSTDYLNISNIPFSSLDHPFMKHYKVNGAPFIILVDKEGKIISEIKPYIQPKTLLDMINKAINDTTSPIANKVFK